MNSELLKIAFNEYCAIDAINSSKLKEFFSDAKLFYKTHIAKVIEPESEERHFVVGRAIHCAVLEPHKFNDDFMVGEHRKSTKDGKANHALALERGKSLISTDEYTLCQAIANELPDQHEWTKYHANAINIHSEVVIVLELGKIKLKVMLDSCIEHADVVYIDDIKSTSKQNDTDFDDAISEYDYLLQFAFYRFVAEQHFKKPVVFRFVFCSKAEPYNIAFVRMDDSHYEVGYKVIDYAISQYVTAQNTGKWYPEQVVERQAVVPNWRMKKYFNFIESNLGV